MFGGFFATYLLLRGATAAWPPEGTEVELLTPTINTFIWCLVALLFIKEIQLLKPMIFRDSEHGISLLR